MCISDDINDEVIKWVTQQVKGQKRLRNLIIEDYL
jgi:hypothetical protein